MNRILVDFCMMLVGWMNTQKIITTFLSGFIAYHIAPVFYVLYSKSIGVYIDIFYIHVLMGLLSGAFVVIPFILIDISSIRKTSNVFKQHISLSKFIPLFAVYFLLFETVLLSSVLSKFIINAYSISRTAITMFNKITLLDYATITLFCYLLWFVIYGMLDFLSNVLDVNTYTMRKIALYVGFTALCIGFVVLFVLSLNNVFIYWTKT